MLQKIAQNPTLLLQAAALNSSNIDFQTLPIIINHEEIPEPPEKRLRISNLENSERVKIDDLNSSLYLNGNVVESGFFRNKLFCSLHVAFGWNRNALIFLDVLSMCFYFYISYRI